MRTALLVLFLVACAPVAHVPSDTAADGGTCACLATDVCCDWGDGLPACGCEATTGFCCGTGATSACVDRNSDPLNCGGCGIVCAAGETCVNRTCE